MKNIIETVGTDGEKYYKCLVCFSVGNWKKFIEKGLCHNLVLRKKKCITKQKLEKQI